MSFQKPTLRRDGSMRITVRITHHIPAEYFVYAVAYHVGWTDNITKGEIEKHIRSELEYSGTAPFAYYTENNRHTAEDYREAIRLVNKWFPEFDIDADEFIGNIHEDNLIEEP